MKSIWDKKCYEKVSWDEISSDVNPHYIHYLGGSKLKAKRKIEEEVLTGVKVGVPLLAILGVISPLIGIVSIAISAGKEIYDLYTEKEKRRIEGVYNKIFPIEGRSDIGIGEREPWMNSTKKLNLHDIGSTGHIIDGIAHGFSLVQAQPKEVKDRKMDFRHNLYLAGGPIPNAYTRNVLYGESIKTPYKFRLDLDERLSNSSPSELKRIGYEMEPNWYICDEDGNEIEGGIPKIENDVLIKDSFMIIKCKNIHPQAGKNTKSVIFAGCHGPGTSASGALIKNKELVDCIYSEVEDNDFQLIGRVSTHGELTKENIIDIQQL